MGTRDTRFPLPKNELFYFDERDSTYKPIAKADGMLPIQSVQKKWKDSFLGTSLDSAKWEVIKTGTGQTITANNGELQITSGTTINAETIIQTKETFSDPFRALFGFKMSQKIANVDLFMEAVSVDHVTGIADGLHSVAWRISGSDSTTATYGVYETQNGGLVRLASAGTTNIANNVTSYNMLELELFADEVWYHSRAMDSNAGRSVSYVRHQQIPDPNAIFKIRIRVLNRGVAPASSTTCYFQFVTVVDYAELTAEITSGRGGGSAGQGMPVLVTNTISAVSTISTAYISPKTIMYTDTTANIAVATPFIGTARDVGATMLYKTYRIRVFADQPLTIDIYHGTNATLTSNRIQQSVQVPANTMTIIEIPLLARYVGLKATNTGSATTTAVEILSVLMGN